MTHQTIIARTPKELWLETEGLVRGSETLMNKATESARQTKKWNMADIKWTPTLTTSCVKEVSIWDCDAVSAAIKESSSSDAGILLVNFASNRRPGGGYRGGAQAQEEDICRRTTLPFAIDPALGLQSDQSFYPLNGHAELACGLVSPVVQILWEASNRQYRLLEPAPSVAVLTVPGYNPASHIDKDCFLPPGSGRSRNFTQEGRARAKERIRLQLAIANQYGLSCLITGAIGCGVFRNDPAEVASIFREVIDEAPAEGTCRRVIFAIPHSNSNNNLAEFERVLGIRRSQ